MECAGRIQVEPFSIGTQVAENRVDDLFAQHVAQLPERQIWRVLRGQDHIRDAYGPAVATHDGDLSLGIRPEMPC